MDLRNKIKPENQPTIQIIQDDSVFEKTKLLFSRNTNFICSEVCRCMALLHNITQYFHKIYNVYMI